MRLKLIEEMNSDDLIRAAHTMEKFGGGFATQIAKAYYVADTTNRATLIKAFGNLFELYGNWGTYGDDRQ